MSRDFNETTKKYISCRAANAEAELAWREKEKLAEAFLIYVPSGVLSPKPTPGMQASLTHVVVAVFSALGWKCEGVGTED